MNKSAPDSVRSAISAIMNHLGSLFANYMGSEQPHVCADYADINLVDAIKRVSGVGDVKNFTAQDVHARLVAAKTRSLRWALRLRTLRTQSASRMRKRQPFGRTTTTFLIRDCEGQADFEPTGVAVRSGSVIRSSDQRPTPPVWGRRTD